MFQCDNLNNKLVIKNVIDNAIIPNPNSVTNSIL